MSTRARIFALLPLAALGVHQLRYQLAFGNDSHHELADQGHAYLASLTPLVTFVAVLLAAELIARLARALRGTSSGGGETGFVPLAVAVAATLIAIYAGQELLEGLLSSDHPTGLAGAFGEGGWWAVPVAICFGIAIALLLRGADAAIVAIVAGRSGPLGGTARPGSPRKPGDVLLPPLTPFAAAAPDRGPPAAAAH